jgi:hypothetical protein
LAKRPRLLLLDANAVFAAFRHGAWNGLCAAYELVVPNTVVRREAIFYVSRETNRRVELDLSGEARDGRIEEVTVPPAEITALRSRFDSSFRMGLDAGEAEALAYLVQQEDDEMRFVTSDAAALQAVGMLGIAERAICLAEALQLCGLGRPLPRQHGPDFFREHISAGLKRFVTGEGLEPGR